MQTRQFSIASLRGSSTEAYKEQVCWPQAQPGQKPRPLAFIIPPALCLRHLNGISEGIELIEQRSQLDCPKELK